MIREEEINFPEIDSQYTDFQKEVIRFYDKNLLVSANAGSGKTRTVIGKIMYLLLVKKIPIKRILITTFTQMASRELQAKLASNISDKILTVNDEELRLFLIRQLEELPNAPIGTLHSFCQDLVRKYFYFLGIEQSFSLLEQNDADFLKNEVLDNLFEKKAVENNQEFFELLDVFNEDRSLLSLKKVFIELLEFVKAKGEGIKFLENAQKSLFENNNKVYEVFNDYFIKYINVFKSQFAKFKLNAMQIKSNYMENICQKFLDRFNLFSENLSFEENYTKFLTMGSYPSIRLKNPTPEENELIEEIKDFKKHYFDDIKKHIKIQSVEELKNENISKDYVCILLSMLKEFDDNYAKVKNEKNTLDFNDLEFYTIQLLKDEVIRKNIKESLDFIFIDEYQDTNEVQEKIVNLCAGLDNVIMVGDVKQSIYGFRNSSPEIFLEKFDKYSANENDGKVITLKQNFRSHKGVLDFCNFIFEKIMTSESSGIDYKNDGYFECGKNFEDKNAKVEIHLLEKLKEDIEEDFSKDYDIKADIDMSKLSLPQNAELNLLKQLIDENLNKDIFDLELNEYRKVQYKDMAILCRNRNEISLISKFFQKHNIPYSAKFNLKLYKQFEVSLLINYLSLIENDFDDIALVSALKSPIGKLSNKDLITIKTFDYEEDLENFYQKVLEYKKLNNDKISEKLQIFYKDLEYFRLRREYLTIKNLVEEILDYFVLNAYFLSYDDGNLKCKNIQIFLDSLNSNYYGKNLTAYLNYIKNFAIDSSYDVEENQSVNSISIETIHSSKGLEYDIVFLYKIDKSFTLRYTNKELYKDKNLGIAIREIDKDTSEEHNSLTRNAFKLLYSQKSIKEELRLLYVALTRAKNRLIMLGEINLDKVKSIENELDILKSKSYLDLLVGSLSKSQIEILKNGNLTVGAYESKFDMFYHGRADYDFILEEIQKIQKDKNLDLEKIEKVINFKYPFEKEINLRLKNSVTGLQRENNENEDLEYNKIDLENENYEYMNTGKIKEDYLFLGNCYHKIMELSNLDINNLENLKKMPEFNFVEENKIINAINILSELKTNRKIVCEQKFLQFLPKKFVDKNYNLDSKVLIQGIVDLMLIGEKDIIILDYKTGKLGEKALREKYKLQLDLYARASEKYFNKPVSRKFIYSFTFNKLIEVF